jgi:transcription-repair coupling factor (superfamily II helicase)
MDRLLCGDVGFGKTEVALRAVFKAAMDGKQSAVLVPTTILALQHYKTALERFDGFPITIEMLSRFRGAREQTAIKKRLKTGEIDIVIGTHRLLSKDIDFKSLGLVVVDEEQRFGVAHKEKLKDKLPNVDVLTLWRCQEFVICQRSRSRRRTVSRFKVTSLSITIASSPRQ